MICPYCTREILVKKTTWQCDHHGIIVVAVTPATTPPSEAILAAIRTCRPQPVHIRRCVVCGIDFKARRPEYRFCQRHLPAWAKSRQAAQGSAA